MFEVQRSVGRLVEARVFKLSTLDDVAAYGRSFGPVLPKASSLRPILCADHRPVVIYPPDVSDRLTELFTSLNKTWELAAILVAPTNATLSMQLQRIVRESKTPSRRVFFSAAEACAFLGPALSPTETARLAKFLDVAPASSPR